MAQTIKHRRGDINLVNQAGWSPGELVVGSGSVENKVVGPIVYIGNVTDVIGNQHFVPVSQLYHGAGVPSENLSSTYGKTLNGLPYYDSTNKKMYILRDTAQGGHIELTFTSESIYQFETEVSAAAAAAGFGSTPDIDLSGLATYGDNVFTGSQVITGSDLLPPWIPNDNDELLDRTSPASSLTNNYALVVSQSSWSWNHNVGHPNSLRWGQYLDNSIFEDYNANTDIAEILRTVVGLISSSHPALVANPAPEPAQYAGFDVEFDGGAQGSEISSTFNNAYIPDSFTNTTLTYLNTKGFNGGAGDTPFENVTADIYYTTVGTLGLTVQSNIAGGDEGDFFDAGPKDKYFTVIGIASQSFSDNQTVTNPNASSNTFTTSSLHRYGVNGAGQDNTIYVETISTDAPTVIPPVYQKARFTDVPLITDRRYAASGENFATKEATGYYRFHDIKVGIVTGSTNIGELADVIGGSLSNATLTLESATTARFMTPINASWSDFTPTSPTNTTPQITSLTATSRSLSGAPYLNSATWNVYDVTSSGLFSPMFYGGTSNIAQLTITDVAVTSLGLDFDNTTDRYARADGGTIDSGRQNIYTGDVELSIGSIPAVTSTVRFDANFGFDINDTSTAASNATQAGVSDSDFKVRNTVRNWQSTTTNTDSLATSYHIAGEFGQDVTSGSMQIFACSDGYDLSTGWQTATQSEKFKGEAYRRTISTADVSGLSTPFDSGSALDLADGGDLQVKPGFLVNPKSSYGYWYPTTGYSPTQHNWYLREFDTGVTGGTVYSGITITLGGANISQFVSLNDITDTTHDNRFALGLIFEYQINNVGTRTRIFDVKGADGSYGGAYDNTSQGDKNPFTDNVDIQADFSPGTDVSTTTLSLSLNSGVGQRIDASNPSCWLLVRYKGQPTSALTSIGMSFS